MIFVDSCVLLDVLRDDPRWAQWSQAQLESAAATQRLVINPVIYAEISVHFDRIEDVNRVLEAARITLADMPREALFLAAKAYQRYRKRGGTRTGTLPDFFIGAHASVMGAPLLTRDTSRYAGYFPALRLIAPGAQQG